MIGAALIAACSGGGASGTGGGGGTGGSGGSEEEGKPTGTVCPTTQTLTYDNFGKEFMQTYCLRCHSASVTGEERQGAPDDHNFDTVEEIRALAEHMDELAGAGPDAVNTSMPEDDPRPNEDARRKLSEWLTCGAP